MKNLSLRSEIKRKSYLKIYSLFEYLLFDHFATMGGGVAQVGCLTARDTVGASPVDAHARTGSDYGFKFQVSSRRGRLRTQTAQPDCHSDNDFSFKFFSRRGRLRTRTAQPDCDVAENLQIIMLKFGHVRKKT